MKKTALILLSAIFIVTLWTGTAFAEGSTTATTTAPVTAPTATVTPAPTAMTDTTVTIAPDNILYSLKRLVESIQVAFTFSPEGKAELLVTLADERLAEAELMSENNKRELVEQVMKAYVKNVKTANEKLEEAAEAGKDVTAVLDDIRIVEQTAGKLVIKATGMLPAESAETLKAQVAGQVKSTLAVQAFAIAKVDYKDSNAAVKTANNELKAAEKSGDEALVTAAKEKLELALQAKTNAEKLKDEVKAYKDDIIKDIKDEDDEDKNDEDSKDKFGQQEELQRKLAKMEEIVAKLQLKRAEQIEKLKNQQGKASEKIEENTNKQLEKKNIKVDKMKEELEKLQTAATTDQALTAAVQSTSQSSIAIDDKDKNDEDENADKDDDNGEDKNKDSEKPGKKNK